MEETPSEFISRVLEKIKEQRVQRISDLGKVMGEFKNEVPPGRFLAELEDAGCRINLETGEIACPSETSNTKTMEGVTEQPKTYESVED